MKIHLSFTYPSSPGNKRPRVLALVGACVTKYLIFVIDHAHQC